MTAPTQAEQPAESGGATGLPRAFGQYLLFDRIGRGGMAEIFLARTHNELGGSRRIVIKEVLPELSQEPAFARMLVQEAKLAGQLHHRNIVPVMDLGRESGRLFIAMEYVEGYDLNRLLRQLSSRRLPLPLEFALLIVREVLQALTYAHRAVDAHGAPLGIVHRDVSPSNVLISFEGEVSLCDFGIARALDMDFRRHPGETSGHDPEESRIQRVRVAGKSAYMAPEHARGESVDARSDLFAVGILLWELCAGRRLYRGTDAEMLQLAREAQIPPLPARNLPDQARLQGILERALCIDPAARYQSGADMLLALEEYALSTSLMASQLRFGSYLTDHFADEIVALRRARERAAEHALGNRHIPVVEVEPATMPSERPKATEAVARPLEPAAQPVRVSAVPQSAVPHGAVQISAVHISEHDAAALRARPWRVWLLGALGVLAFGGVAYWLNG
ncbi:MAG TPA: serine/threonine-protein kinase [Polyangiales bacterium]|nr:serine/threonine-protein kinase [Polyangiales bacterium]